MYNPNFPNLPSQDKLRLLNSDLILLERSYISNLEYLFKFHKYNDTDMQNLGNDILAIINDIKQQIKDLT